MQYAANVYQQSLPLTDTSSAKTKPNHNHIINPATNPHPNPILRHYVRNNIDINDYFADDINEIYMWYSMV